MYFELIGEITHIETFASGSAFENSPVAEILWSRTMEKRKGFAQVRLADGKVCRAEVHWYEATGIGRRELKIKRLID